MKFLGLRLCDHDSNITYTDGTKVKYYNSERDYQIKHHGFGDLNQWFHVIKKWKINPEEIDGIAITIDAFTNKKIQFDEKILYGEIEIPIFRVLGFKCPIFRVDHHYAHYLSSWMFGEFDVGIVSDSFGDDYVGHSVFRGDKALFRQNVNKNHTLSNILGWLGLDLGMDGNELDFAGKLMALKGYGARVETDEYFEILDIRNAWQFKYNLCAKFNHLYNNPAEFQEFCNNFARAHVLSENTYVQHFLEYTDETDSICYSGGVAQNTVINSRIKEVRPNLQIPPHCNDAGHSLGLVEFLRKYYDQENFDSSGFPFWQSDEVPKSTPTKLTIKNTAEMLARGKIVGWYQGRGEIGPRALGNRSILMSPMVHDGKDILNSKVKNREFFRPFGASVLEEKTQDYFDFPHKSPYMLYVMDVLDKESYPSITHADGTCRVQTVSKDHEYYYDLIEEFEKLTGVPMLLNTSLNVGGKPICGYETNALDILTRTDMDALVIGNQSLTLASQ